MEGAGPVGGGVGTEILSVALLLVMLPALLLTTTSNWARLSVEITGGVVYAEEFAPAITLPFFNH